MGNMNPSNQFLMETSNDVKNLFDTSVDGRKENIYIAMNSNNKIINTTYQNTRTNLSNKIQTNWRR